MAALKSFRSERLVNKKVHCLSVGSPLINSSVRILSDHRKASRSPFNNIKTYRKSNEDKVKAHDFTLYSHVKCVQS